MTVQVYREWRRPAWEERDAAGGARSRRAPAEGAESQAARPESAPRQRADAPSAAAPPDAPIGTTSGDDVASSVRTVRFVAATAYPEASAVIDYGQAAPRPWEPRGGELLGMRIAEDRDGTRIVDVAPGSPADEAGLRPWDVIVRLDTTSRPSPGLTRRIVGGKRAGDYTFVRVRRGGHELAVKIRG